MKHRYVYSAVRHSGSRKGNTADRLAIHEFFMYSSRIYPVNADTRPGIYATYHYPPRITFFPLKRWKQRCQTPKKCKQPDTPPIRTRSTHSQCAYAVPCAP